LSTPKEKESGEPPAVDLRFIRLVSSDGVFTSEGDMMKRLVVLLVGTALFLNSCGMKRVGEMQRESPSVGLENA
jgi:hypothetical protein